MSPSHLVRAVVIGAAWLCAGCIPVYIAQAANAPLLRKRGEFKLAGYSGTNGLDLQGAVAVTDNVGIIADISTNRFDEGDNFHTYGELGAGYFTPLSERVRIEFYGGAGAGESGGEFEWLGKVDRASGMYYRGFGQANIGMTGDVVDVGFCARVSYVGYTFDERPGELPPNASEVFFEPVGFFRVGYKWIKFGIQAGLTIPMLTDDQLVETNPFHFTMGLHTKFKGFE